MRAQDRYFDSSDGLRLYCRIYGSERTSGLRVLCLPGLTRNSRDFAGLAEQLAQRDEVFTPDLRGRGRSSWDPEPGRYQLPTYVQDAWTILDSNHVNEAVVIGTSLGALMGMLMAATQPTRIRALILNDAGAELELAGLQRIAGYVGKLPPVSSWDEAARQTQSVYGAALPGLTPAQWLDYARRGYREAEDGRPVPDLDPHIAEAFRSPPTAPLDLWALYAQIPARLPMLIIRGALSDLLSEATVRRMVQEKTSAQSVTVANRGHAPLLDEPECVSAINAFLNRLRAAL